MGRKWYVLGRASKTIIKYINVFYSLDIQIHYWSWHDCFLWVSINQSVLHFMKEGGLSENVKHSGGRTEWLADKKCWEMLHRLFRGLFTWNKVKRNTWKTGSFIQLHLLETHTHRPTAVSAVTTNRAAGDLWSRDASLKSAVLCKNSLLLFVQLGQAQTRWPGWKHVWRTSPPSVKSLELLSTAVKSDQN